MTRTLTVLFQVLVASSFSFVGALLIALAGAYVLRVRDGRARLLVILLPLAKLGVELARGVPDGAFFWQKLQGAAQELGGFRIGFGVARFGPLIDISLSAKWHGDMHPQSAADLCMTILTRKVAPNAPAIVAAVLVGVGLLRLAGLVSAVARRDRSWLRDAVIIDERGIDVRRVTIVTSASWRGAPFATGLFRPLICLPAHVAASLSGEELEAVIQHELAHLAGAHALVVGAILVVQRAFWFLPGLRLLAREVRGQIEICADDTAIRVGIAPAALASALVRVAELVGPAQTEPAPALALFDRPSVLARRVGRLLTAQPTLERWMLVAARAIALALLVTTVLRATTLGNP